MNDDHEPGRERTVGIGRRGASTQPGKVVFAQRLANAGKDVHYVVRIRRIATNRAEDHAAIPLDEERPRRFTIALAERFDPRFHTTLRVALNGRLGADHNTRQQRRARSRKFGPSEGCWASLWSV